jgi:hypothetical protein
MRWNQGRAEIERLIADGELQRVPPNREHADQLFRQARKDLSSAQALADAPVRGSCRLCTPGLHGRPADFGRLV